MKKLTTALLAAGLLLSASACSSPQLSTAETCDRVRTVVSSPTGNMGKTGMIKLANQIRPIEAVASDDLKPALGSFIEYADEASKETPDEARLAEMQSNNEAANTALSSFCR